METNITDFNSLEQGLAGKVSELEAQRLMRETLLVDITLEVIANGVVSKEQDIIQLMSGKPLQGRDVTVISDRDAITEWSAAITKMADLANFTVFDICRQKAPEGNLKFDIADYIQQQHPVPF